MACCPAGAHGELHVEYTPKGELVDLDGVPCYVVGQGGKALIVAHDIFGIDSGRTKAICDRLSSELNVMVLLPALFDQGAGVGGQAAASTVEALIFAPKGSSILGFPWRLIKTLWHARSFVGAIKAHNWAYVEPKLAKVVAYAKSKITDPSQSRLGTPADTSTSKLALLGFCWGGWLVARASASREYSCAAACHPSFQVMSLVGDKVEAVCGAVECPQMLLAAKEDSADVKIGGKAHKIFEKASFGDKCVFKTFDEMKHGWVNRGELEKAEIEKAYEEAMSLLKDFYIKHLVA